VPVGAGIACAPVDGVRFRLVGASDPCGRGTRLPGVARPGLVAGLAFGGDGVEAPDAPAGLCVVSVEEAADAEFAAGDAGDDFVLDGERRARRGLADFVVCDLGLPAQTARAGIERNQVCIKAGIVDQVAMYGDAAVYAPTTEAEILGKFPVVGPVSAASAGVQRLDFVGRLGDVQDAIDRDGRSFNG